MYRSSPNDCCVEAGLRHTPSRLERAIIKLRFYHVTFHEKSRQTANGIDHVIKFIFSTLVFTAALMGIISIPSVSSPNGVRF